MTTANNANTKLAVLIDADNAPADIIDRLLEEIAKYGIASVKRIYGDWSHGLSKWKAALLPHAIIPVQQFAYTKGKNATDMALVIDAMDLLYSGNFDGFCIVSSDSDFTRLASRLRESGRTVYGFGEKKTPEAFRKACDKFVYTEIFRPNKTQSKARSDGKNSSDADSTTEPAADALTLIKRAVRENADDLGWANLGPIGSYINKTNPDFDSRLYGYGKLSELIKSFDIFEHRTDNNQLQVRRRSDKAADKTESRQPESQKQPENTAAANNADAAESQAKGRKARKTGSEGSLKNQEGATADTPAAQPKPAAKTKNGKLPVTRVIPTVQQAVDAAADAEGWARLSDVLKQLAILNINPQNYGFDTDRELVHAIYADWLEIKKAGRGERLRVNKRFVSKD